MKEKRDVWEACAERVRKERWLTLGKKCKNEYLVIEVTVTDNIVTYIKIYYRFYMNSKGYWLGMKEPPKKIKAGYENIPVERFIENELYSFLENGYLPVIFERFQGEYGNSYLREV